MHLARRLLRSFLKEKQHFYVCPVLFSGPAGGPGASSAPLVRACPHTRTHPLKLSCCRIFSCQGPGGPFLLSHPIRTFWGRLSGVPRKIFRFQSANSGKPYFPSHITRTFFGRLERCLQKTFSLSWHKFRKFLFVLPSYTDIF